MILELQKKRMIVRYVLLAIVLLVLSVLQNTPHCFPTLFGCRAVLLIPAVVAVSMFERDLRGMLFGVFAGALWGISSTGGDWYAILLLAVGFVCGSLINNTLRNNIITAFLLSAFWLLLYFAGYWCIRYVIGGLDSAAHMLLRYYLPSFLYSLFLSPFLFLLVHRVENRFSEK